MEVFKRVSTAQLEHLGCSGAYL